MMELCHPRDEIADPGLMAQKDLNLCSVNIRVWVEDEVGGRDNKTIQQ